MGADPAAVVIAHVLPLAAGAMVSPAVLGASVEVLLASGQRGRRMLALYGVGCAAAVTAVLVVSTVLPQRGQDSSSQHPNDVIDILLGCVLLVMAAVIGLRRPKPATTSPVSRVLASRWAGPAVLLLGVAMMATNVSTVVLVLAGAREASSAADAAVRVAAYVILAVSALVPVLLPLGWVTVAPASAERTLQRLNTVISQHGRVLGIVVCLVTAAYLLAHGFRLV